MCCRVVIGALGNFGRIQIDNSRNMIVLLGKLFFVALDKSIEDFPLLEKLGVKGQRIFQIMDSQKVYDVGQPVRLFGQG